MDDKPRPVVSNKKISTKKNRLQGRFSCCFDVLNVCRWKLIVLSSNIYQFFFIHSSSSTYGFFSFIFSSNSAIKIYELTVRENGIKSIIVSPLFHFSFLEGFRFFFFFINFPYPCKFNYCGYAVKKEFPLNVYLFSISISRDSSYRLRIRELLCAYYKYNEFLI